MINNPEWRSPQRLGMPSRVPGLPRNTKTVVCAECGDTGLVEVSTGSHWIVALPCPDCPKNDHVGEPHQPTQEELEDIFDGEIPDNAASLHWVDNIHDYVEEDCAE